jgi:hypothetical protein
MESGSPLKNPFHLPENLTFHFLDVDIHQVGLISVMAYSETP